jgi:hypothetical protein
LAPEDGKVVSPTHRTPLPPKIFLVLISVTAWVNPRVIERPKELCQCKILITPSGIEPATSRLVTQCFNELRHRVPPEKELYNSILWKKTSKFQDRNVAGTHRNNTNIFYYRISNITFQNANWKHENSHL